MSSNSIYKLFGGLSTAGILVIAGCLLPTLFKQSNSNEQELSKTIIEIKNARKEALTEVKSMKIEALKEIKILQSNTMKDLEEGNASSITKLTKARNNAFDEISKVQNKVLNELKVMSTNESESWWLILVARNGGIWDGSQTSAAWALPMKGETQCEAAGLKVQGDKNFHGKVYQHLRYSCVKGK